MLNNLPLIAADPSPPTLRSEIESVIMGLRTNKAAGPDGIKPELPKVDCNQLVDLYLKFAFTALEEGHFSSSCVKPR